MLAKSTRIKEANQSQAVQDPYSAVALQRVSQRKFSAALIVYDDDCSFCCGLHYRLCLPTILLAAAIFLGEENIHCALIVAIARNQKQTILPLQHFEAILREPTSI
jgi:hypothetical protein